MTASQRISASRFLVPPLGSRAFSCVSAFHAAARTIFLRDEPAIWNHAQGVHARAFRCRPDASEVARTENHPLQPKPGGDDLESVLAWLQEVEINVWISTTPPVHIAVGVRDPYGGDRPSEKATVMLGIAAGPPLLDFGG